MASHVILLRGINLGPRNRVSMPALRELFTGAGFEDVRTYVQSGNIVLSSGSSPARVARDSERLLADRLGLSVAVVVRTGAELADVVRRNPLQEVAVNPKRYQVSFLAAEPSPDVVERCAALAAPWERVVAIGREIYAWHPDGVARSRLWAHLAGSRLGVSATARNWTTVTALLAMAGQGGPDHQPR